MKRLSLCLLMATLIGAAGTVHANTKGLNLKPFQKAFKQLALDNPHLNKNILNRLNNDITTIVDIKKTPTGIFLSISQLGAAKNLKAISTLPITELEIKHSYALSLDDLKGLKLTHLYFESKGRKPYITDMSVLKGMPLTSLTINHTRIKDISVLKGMALTYLDLGYNSIDDITPLKGMKLKHLNLYWNKGIKDISVVKDMPLESINIGLIPRIKDTSVLKTIKTLKTINKKPAAEFFK